MTKPIPSFEDRLDAEHLALLEMMPAGMDGLGDIQKAREAMKEMLNAVNIPDIPGVNSEDIYIPGPDEGQDDIMLRVSRPENVQENSPVFYHIHGGGMCLGSVESEDFNCRKWARDTGCTVVSVEYRLAPEHPHPAPIEDCYAGLKWVHDNAEQLGVNRDRIVIGGGSAGGGLAACLALLARDRGEVPVAFQLLIYPMLDDRNNTPSANYVQNPKVWNQEANAHGWKYLLGDKVGGPDVSPYAAAARATDLSGLPETFIIVSELDMFLDEDIDYAKRLLQAGVRTELQVHPDGFHGSSMMLPDSKISKKFDAAVLEALKRALTG